MRPKMKAIGSRGSWFAKVNGEILPCVHKHWLEGLRYCDPNLKPGKPYWNRFAAAIMDGRKVILTKGDLLGGTKFRRTGYIGIWSVAHIDFSESGLRFDLDNQLADLV